MRRVRNGRFRRTGLPNTRAADPPSAFCMDHPVARPGRAAELHVRGAADKAANLRGESPLPPIARFRRVAYPEYGKRLTVRCPDVKAMAALRSSDRSGGSDLGGEQTRRSEH